MAVIEVAIAPDGRAVGASPIYVSRRGTETEFAESAASWRWSPEETAAISPFWRASVRFEIRCTYNGRRGLLSTFNVQRRKWESERSVAPLGDFAAGPGGLVQLKAELARRTARSGAESPQLVPVLMELADRSASLPEERAYLAQAEEIALTAKAPVDVTVPIEFRRSLLDIYLIPASRKVDTAKEFIDRMMPRLMAELVDKKSLDTRAAAFVRVQQAEAADRSGQRPLAARLYQEVVAQPESSLPANDPIRQTALLRLASAAAANRDVVSAQRFLDMTGLTAQQCALADVRPLAINQKVTSAQFPKPALEWGFEGLVVIGFDIDTSGVPRGVRTLAAYPPLVFSQPTEKIVTQFRYEPVFRAGADLGCTGMTQSFRFKIPKR